MDFFHDGVQMPSEGWFYDLELCSQRLEKHEGGGPSNAICRDLLVFAHHCVGLRWPSSLGRMVVNLSAAGVSQVVHHRKHLINSSARFRHLAQCHFFMVTADL
ncbi:hypothetical protein M569_16493 [Genlisea aurea]|uniref:Uncharacterized protein n=1 Tax=Genlisea aurea TaxID=192259 RepID=S8DG20_9LAMI|nr:hypothetical protein M569_16493 [Genlisea aurea]